MTTVYERRLREFRFRVAVRALEYRQRRHARGVWFRLRQLLAFASEAYAVPRGEGNRLIAEGRQPEPVGEELAPSRRSASSSCPSPTEARASATQRERIRPDPGGPGVAWYEDSRARSSRASRSSPARVAISRAWRVASIASGSRPACA